jgi:hypothetical protein
MGGQAVNLLGIKNRVALMNGISVSTSAPLSSVSFLVIVSA